MSGDAERPRVDVGGLRSRLVQAGPADAREAVVFVHGNPGSADDWKALVEAGGGGGMRALAFDLPDFGETAAPPGFEHTVPGYAGFVSEALATLGVERVHLVCHDFGGPIALTWAAEHVDALASMTLIDTGVLPGYRWHRLARIWRTPGLGELFQATATRRAFRWLLNRNEPRGLPPAFVDGMYDHYDRRTTSRRWWSGANMTPTCPPSSRHASARPSRPPTCTFSPPAATGPTRTRPTRSCGCSSNSSSG